MFIPTLVLVVIAIWVGENPVASILVGAAGLWAFVGFWMGTYGWRRSPDLVSTRRYPRVPLDVGKRVEAEIDAMETMPPHTWMYPEIVASMWRRFGSSLVEREMAMQGLAESRGWHFGPFDPMLTGMLARAEVTTYAPSTCRNVCRGSSRSVNFVLTDLTTYRFNHGDRDPGKGAKLSVATMFATPFSAPRSLRVVRRRNRLAHLGTNTGELRTESQAFNNQFRVFAHDTAWARLILNPTFVEMLGHSDVSSLVIAGGQLGIVTEPWIDPARALDFVDLGTKLRSSVLTAAAPSQ
jgi:Protein of unknown function (DUF3137)